MGFIRINNQDLYYTENKPSEDRGSLVFIHGSGADNNKWQSQMEHLPEGFSGIAVDLPGHGHSPGPVRENIADMARLICDFIETMNLPHPVVLVGHSMGAAISLSVALDNKVNASNDNAGMSPVIVDGIILIGAGARMKVFPSFLDALKNGQSDPGFIRLAFSLHTPADLVEAEVKNFTTVDTAILYNDFAACNKFDVKDLTERIDLPTLIIVGEDDQLTPVKYSQFLHDSILNSQLLIVPEAGHLVMLEKSLAVNQAIQGFVARL